MDKSYASLMVYGIFFFALLAFVIIALIVSIVKSIRRFRQGDRKALRDSLIIGAALIIVILFGFRIL